MKKGIRILLKRASSGALALILLLGFLCFDTTVKAIESDSGTLTSNEEQDAQLEALGISSEQPERYSPSGEVVDKSASPFGVSSLTYYSVRQLALSTTGSDKKLSLNTQPLTSTRKVNSSYTWSSATYTAVTAADVDGNGTDEVITAAVVNTTLLSTSKSLCIRVSDYTKVAGKITNNVDTKEYMIVNTLDFGTTLDKTQNPLQIEAADLDKDGNDEIVILANRTLYICEASMSSASIVSSTKFDSSSSIAKISDSAVPAIEIASGDTNNDGFNELLVTTGAQGFANINQNLMPKLLIYDSADLSSPCAAVSLANNKGGPLFTSVSVDVGDVFGEGENRIVLAGRVYPFSTFSLTTVCYDAATESYDTNLNNTMYSFAATNYQCVGSELLGLKCVNLTTRVAGDPEYIVFGGFIYRYDYAEDTFVQKNVTTATNTSGKDGNGESKSNGSITNVNVSKDTVYIFDTIVGNFDDTTLTKMDSSSGVEQIILLHYNEWYSGGYAYMTICSMDKDGNITA